MGQKEGEVAPTSTLAILHPGVYRLLEELQRCILTEPLGGCPEDSPAEKRGGIVLLDIPKEPLGPCMPAPCPDTTLNLDRDMVRRYRVVESPPTLRVEAVFLDTLHPEVGFTDSRENITYSGLIRPTSRVVCFPHNLLIPSAKGRCTALNRHTGDSRSVHTR